MCIFIIKIIAIGRLEVTLAMGNFLRPCSRRSPAQPAALAWAGLVGAETDLFVVYWCVICNWWLIYRSPAQPAVPRRSGNLGPRAILPIHFIFYTQNLAFENVATSFALLGHHDTLFCFQQMQITRIAVDLGLGPVAGRHPEDESCGRQRGQI